MAHWCRPAKEAVDAGEAVAPPAGPPDVQSARRRGVDTARRELSGYIGPVTEKLTRGAADRGLARVAAPIAAGEDHDGREVYAALSNPRPPMPITAVNHPPTRRAHIRGAERFPNDQTGASRRRSRDDHDDQRRLRREQDHRPPDQGRHGHRQGHQGPQPHGQGLQGRPPGWQARTRWGEGRRRSAGGQGPAGSPGRDGAGATVVGSLPYGSLSIAANETKEKTLGTVGPFTVVLSCENDTRSPDPEGTYWDTWASLYVRTPGTPNGYIAGAATGNWDWGLDLRHRRELRLLAYAGVGKIGIVANFSVTQTSCSVSSINTSLN